jgi:P-type Cu+ transporter
MGICYIPPDTRKPYYFIKPWINYLQDKNRINKEEIICYHCGDICKEGSVTKEEKNFCCKGCKIVYEILDENNLCKYYSIDRNPGISPKVRSEIKYEFLDDVQIKKQLLDFSDGNTSMASFFIPQIHCSSCIWLLENLYKLDAGITHSRVNFPEKKITFKYLETKTSLRKISELLDSLGYEPLINLDAAEKKGRSSHLKKLYYKVGVAGFAFGNIMLLSFPEYLGLEKFSEPGFHKLFGYLNLILSLPVFFYSGSEYYISAYKGLKNKIINIDFPLFLGIFVLFARSVYEILAQTGAGYMDSMTGLVFFLLAGKIFQSKTYGSMNFERSYKSFFPFSVTVIKTGKETTIPLASLKKGDRIIVRNNELIPADSILFKGDGNIDYGFVTGESLPVQKVLGEIISAGGRQAGGAIELEVLNDVSQSYLTQLWNNDVFTKEDTSRLQSFSNSISKYFTIAVLMLAAGSAAYWMPYGLNIAVNVFTAVLIVACPCALALAIPFTYGNVMRIFGRNKFYVKNASVIEKLSKISSVVFDKTGTLTQSGKSEVVFRGRALSDYELMLIKSVAKNSTHPLSRKIYEHLTGFETIEVKEFAEITGKGISGIADGNKILLGSELFASGNPNAAKIRTFGKSSRVYLSINGEVPGKFEITNSYRGGLAETITRLEKKVGLHLLSGDNNNEAEYLENLFRQPHQLRFGQSPEDKLEYIKGIQFGGNVLMIGDGLNDAGALKQSDVGISVSDDVSNFSPACDGILESGSFTKIPDILEFSRLSVKVIITSFSISFIYNIAALFIAIEGMLTPIVAAILMPVSSISVVVFSVVATNFLAKRKKLS